MFAGLLIDDSNEQIHIFRDKVGEKPLFYRLTDSHLEVMSENTFDDKPTPDLANNVKRALLGFLPNDNKYINNVRRVTPGTYITIDLKTFKSFERQYWEWPNRPRKGLQKSSSELSTFKKILYSSVESRLAADVPVASLLSGGIDSAVVTKVAQDILGYPLPAFTLAFKNSDHDESNTAWLSAKAIGCDLTVVKIDAETMSELVPNCIESMKEPILDSACLSLYSLCAEVSKNFKVALTGDGGDELFQGYSLFGNLKGLSLAKKVPKLSRLMIRVALNSPISFFENSYVSNFMKFERAYSVLKHIDLNPVVLALSPLGGTILLDDVICNLRSVDTLDLSVIPNNTTSEYLEKFYRTEILPHLYLEKADRMSMTHGLELRAPLLAPRLIDFASQISQSEIIKSEKKVLLRRFAAEFLPSEVIYTKKHGFSPPLVEILTHLEQPVWNLAYLGLSQGALNQNWQLAIQGNENAAYAAWNTLILNYHS
jgi:asparagine synthase (glutamine-hydrolysing)